MKKYLFFILIIIITGCHPIRLFQIECNSVSADATYVIDVTIEAKKEMTDLGAVKLDAIDGVLFRGITGNNCVTHKPILAQAKAEVNNNPLIKAIYGRKRGYDKYITNIAPVSTKRLTNTSKPTTQIKYRVAINKDLLQKDLAKAGLIKPLNSGF